MCSMVIAGLVALGATRVWTEPSTVNVYPGSGPGVGAEAAVRLYAAPGESESFQVCVQPRRDLRDVVVSGEAMRGGIPAPRVRRVGYLELASPAPGSPALAPDPLLDAEPADIAAGETAAYWITYDIPRDAKPGIWKGRVVVDPTRGRNIYVEVTIEIFDFALPEAFRLRTLAPFERDVLSRFYGLPADDLEAWAPVYEVLARTGVSVSPWQGEDLVTLHADGTVDASLLQRHIEAMMATAPLGTINLGDGAAGLERLPRPERPADRDPLPGFLADVAQWLDARGWLDRAVVIPMSIPERPWWAAACEEYLRVWRGDGRVQRILAHPFHPAFEGYADIWAVPLRYYRPLAVERLRHGMSLSAVPRVAAETVTASSNGPAPGYAPYETRPEDAYDGCLFSAWCSASVPNRKVPEWLRLDLEEAVETAEITLGWLPGFEPADIVAGTSVDGRDFDRATITWEHHFTPNPLERSWSVARMRFPKRFRSLRLEFRGSAHGTPVAVVEVEPGAPPDPATVASIGPKEVWLCPLPGEFPRVSADGYAGEARLLPWVCWRNGLSGSLLPSMAAWPESWQALCDAPPQVWTGAGNGERFLLYPGRGAPLMSIRAERLRDGLEDYEYMMALQERLAEPNAADEGRALLARKPVLLPVDADEMKELLDEVLRMRVEVGRMLSR